VTKPGPRVAPAGNLSRDDITLAWGDVVLGKLPRAAKTLYSAGRFVEVRGDGAVLFALPNEPHMKRCEELRPMVEQVLADHLGRSVTLALTVDEGSPPAAAPAPKAPPRTAPPPSVVHEPEEVIDVHELVDAPPDNRTSVDRLTEAFPGAELLQEEGDG
jgi:hypothetical protein